MVHIHRSTEGTRTAALFRECAAKYLNNQNYSSVDITGHAQPVATGVVLPCLAKSRYCSVLHRTSSIYIVFALILTAVNS